MTYEQTHNLIELLKNSREEIETAADAARWYAYDPDQKPEDKALYEAALNFIEKIGQYAYLANDSAIVTLEQ